MNDRYSIQRKAEKAGALWKEKNYVGARLLYEEIVHSISSPLDKAKMMGNIAQLYAEEGDKDGGLNAARAAIKIINGNELYESLEGSHLRGYLNGFINRLENKGRWETLPYDESIPIDMNLNVFDRVCAHFAVTIISGVIFSAVSTMVSIPSIDISLFHEKIILFSLAGFIFSIFFTSGLLRQFTAFIMAISSRSAQDSLGPAVNLLSAAALLYVVFLPSAFWNMASEIVIFVITGVLGATVCYGFLYKRHGNKIK